MQDKNKYINITDQKMKHLSAEVLDDDLEILDDDLEVLDDDLDDDLDDNLDEEFDYIGSDVTEMEGNVDFDLIYRLNTNKHRQEGKHALQRDTIFKGKLEEKHEIDNYIYNGIDSNAYNTFKIVDIEFDSSTDDYINQNNLTKDVFDILDEKTTLNFLQNRRKPNKEVFNGYYDLLLKNLGFRYTKSEIFVELSYYFTDNIFNMFKLLDKESATTIIKELINKGYLKDFKNVEFL